MNRQQETTSNPGWTQPVPEPAFLEKHADDIDDWMQLRDQVTEIAIDNGWTKAEVTRRSGMKETTFSQWFSGNYPGVLANQNKTIRIWVDAYLEAMATPQIPQSPSFLRTRMANEITQTLQWAQMTADLVMITVPAGSGKTYACRHYRATHPHVFMATISPHTRSVHGMLVEIAAELDVLEHNPARLTRAIGAKLGRLAGVTAIGSLLIVDEAQNLVDDAINQLRYFSDIYQCGIALVGNEEVYTRFAAQERGKSYAQLKRRVGKHLKRAKPYAEDIQSFISAWGVSDSAATRLLTGIGLKGGALGQIDKTMKLASMIALGEEREVTVRDIEAAWKNRDVEDMA